MSQALSLANLQAAMAQNNTKIKEWVNTQIGNITVITISWVDSLPTENISTSTIYLVKSTDSTEKNNIYDEYVYHEATAQWETLGQVDAGRVDLINYYSKTEVDNLLANLTVESYSEDEITEMIATIWGE